METGLTEIDIASFTGRDVGYFDTFVYEAIDQSSDLFELATGLTELPLRGLDARLSRRGVLAMAEALYEGNKYRDARHSPFKSETIGSYTYTLAEGSVLAGIPTGISWFDLAVVRLGRGVETISSSSISAFDRRGDIVSSGGRPILVGPADTYVFSQEPLDAELDRGPRG